MRPLVIAASILLLAALAGAAPRPAAGDEPDRFAKERDILTSGSPPERAQAIDRLLATAEPAVIPVLRDALALEDRELRIRITRGLQRVFPEASTELFLELLGDADLRRREAAVFAIALLDDPRVLPRLIAALSAEERPIREAAARSLSMRGREEVNAAASRAHGEPRPVSPIWRRILAETRAAVLADLIEHGADELRRSLRDQFADRECAAGLRAAYARKHAGEPVAARIEALGRRLAPWCPRSVLPEGTRLVYTIRIENLFAGSQKSVAIGVDAADFATLHFWRYALDRAVHLQLPLDELLLDPERCAPSIAADGEGTDAGTAAAAPVEIRYRLLDRTDLRCGIGILNIAYWEGTSTAGAEVALRLDPATGLPREERALDLAGETVMAVRYEEWIELPGDGAAPGRIIVEMPRARIGAQEASMRYTLRFRVVEGVWLLADAEAAALVEGGEELRALAAVDSVAVTRPAPTPGAGSADPPVGAPGSGGGASTGESTGQGVSGGSPRR
jgi:HEAT repeat protein